MKLKELNLKDIQFTKTDLANGTIINVKYSNEQFQFQTPKASIVSIEKEYLVLDINVSLFFTRLGEIERFFEQRFRKEVKSSMYDTFIKVKLPFHFSKPQFKVYCQGRQFNYLSLQPGDQIICLLTLDRIWETHEINYLLNVKEIMLLKNLELQ